MRMLSSRMVVIVVVVMEEGEEEASSVVVGGSDGEWRWNSHLVALLRGVSLKWWLGVWLVYLLLVAEPPTE